MIISANVPADSVVDPDPDLHHFGVTWIRIRVRINLQMTSQNVRI
jgi:hypothetical protein